MWKPATRRARHPFRHPLGRSLVALPLLFASGSARALDPGVALRLDSRAVQSPAAGERLDVNGTNQTSALLPAQPSVAWQTRLAPPLFGELAVDDRGRLLVAHAVDRLTALDRAGHSAWSVRVGGSLASGPLPIAGGRCLVVTRDAEIVRVLADGTIEGRELIPGGELEGPVVAASTRDGGAIVAAGARLARLGPSGTHGWDTRLPDPIRAVFEWRTETLAVGRSGLVFSHATVGGPRKLASFEEPLRAVALAGDRLFGVGRHALIELDLVSKQRRILFSEELGELRELAMLGPGKWRLIATRATLIDVDASGRELGRLPFSLAESGGEFGTIVVDRAARTLLSVTGSALLLVTPQGDWSTLSESGCADAMRPTPLTDGAFVAACRSGLLRTFVDRRAFNDKAR